jgi:hypothetical protein
MPKLNSPDKYDSITVLLNEIDHPTAFANSVKNLMLAGCSEEDAREQTATLSIELELYFEVGYGLMAVQSDAVEGGANIFSPYTTEQYEDSDE